MCLVLDNPKQQPHQRLMIKIHELILEDCWLEQLGISCEQVGSTIHKDLDMQKLSAKWVPKWLNADQKHQWCQSSEQFLE
jgi:hypothetical protein